MRTSLSIFVALTVAAGTLSAQSTTTNLFGISPGSTDATSRSGVALTATGDILVEVRSVSWESPLNANGATGADFISVGDMGSTPPPAGTPGDGRVNGFQVTIQDENASTTETFDFCVVTEAPGLAIGNPAAPPAGNAFGPEVLLRTTALTTPPGPAGPPPTAWIMTATLGTPADVIPNGLTAFTSGMGNNSWYFGVGLAPSAGGSAANDGASVHMSSFDGLGAPFPNQGDNPRDGVLSLQQARDVTNGLTVGKSSTSRTQEIWIQTEAPIFHHGAAISAPAQIGPDPNFGAAGSYPDSCGSSNTGRVSFYGPSAAPPGTYTGRAGVGDGYGLRIASVKDIGTSVVVALGAGVVGGPGTISGFSGAQIYLPFFDGAFVNSFSSVFFPVGVIPASGILQLTLQTPSAAQPLCLPAPGRMSGQAAILAASKLKFSNGASASF